LSLKSLIFFLITFLISFVVVIVSIIVLNAAVTGLDIESSFHVIYFPWTGLISAGIVLVVWNFKQNVR
jgi:hypothetical protein